jgi:hypothetical protein
VLNRYDSILTSSNLQFGFNGYSTSMCSMSLKETLKYYRRNKSTVYCTTLDATKAFDRVEYCKLVRLLIKKNVPPVIIRILLHMYLLHVAKVSWNGSSSNNFRVLNGVCQGAILSPVLLCVYFDTLVISLAKTGLGCHIGSFFVGALAYADDWVLLAPIVRTPCGVCYGLARITLLNLTLCLMAVNPNVLSAIPPEQPNM